MEGCQPGASGPEDRVSIVASAAKLDQDFRSFTRPKVDEARYSGGPFDDEFTWVKGCSA